MGRAWRRRCAGRDEGMAFCGAGGEVDRQRHKGVGTESHESGGSVAVRGGGGGGYV